jgi:hypothetical protein
MKCIGCVIDHRPAPSHSASFLAGVAFGENGPLPKRIEILGNLCPMHRKTYGVLTGEASGALLIGLEKLITG